MIFLKESNMKPYRIIDKSPNFKFMIDQQRQGVYNTLHISDLHMDSSQHDKKLLTKHLKQAKGVGADVFIYGDVIDGMQGKSDRRGSKKEMQAQVEQVGGASEYLNNLSDMIYNYFEPYKENIKFISYGNHETAIMRHLEFDPLLPAVRRLNDNGANIALGAYGGYIIYNFHKIYNGKVGNSNNIILNYHHGKRGNAQVTHGVINTNRKLVWNEGTDIYITGDIHKSWHLDMVTRKVDPATLKTIYKNVLYLQTPSYKIQGDTGHGYEVENDFPALPTGGYWIQFYNEADVMKYKYFRAD